MRRLQRLHRCRAKLQLRERRKGNSAHSGGYAAGNHCHPDCPGSPAGGQRRSAGGGPERCHFRRRRGRRSLRVWSLHRPGANPRQRRIGPRLHGEREPSQYPGGPERHLHRGADEPCAAEPARERHGGMGDQRRRGIGLQHRLGKHAHLPPQQLESPAAHPRRHFGRRFERSGGDAAVFPGESAGRRGRRNGGFHQDGERADRHRRQRSHHLQHPDRRPDRRRGRERQRGGGGVPRHFVRRERGKSHAAPRPGQWQHDQLR